MEGACSSVGDCWKGLGIRSTPKCLWNSEVVGFQRMPKVSEVGIENSEMFSEQKTGHPLTENTWKDITPFPDQDTICHDIA